MRRRRIARRAQLEPTGMRSPQRQGRPNAPFGCETQIPSALTTSSPIENIGKDAAAAARDGAHAPPRTAGVPHRKKVQTD